MDALQGKHNAAFRHCYDAEKSAVENYKSHRFVAEAIGQWLESQLPEDFEARFLGKSAERRQSLLCFHISRIIDCNKTVKPANCESSVTVIK